jgi:cytochrome c-type biogenesis protein CcmF
MIPPSIGALVLGAIGVLAGARGMYAVLAFAFVGYAAVGNLREYWIGVRARHRAHGENWGTALVRLILGNRRRYGGYVAHIGVLLVALGVTASSTFRSEREATLLPGELLTVAGHTVRLQSVWGREEPQRSVIGATMDVLGTDGVVIGTVEPRMNYYHVSDQPVPTPDVRSSIRGDLYVNLSAFEPNGANATVKVIVEPLVPWIWFGGFVIVLGAVIGMFHRGRRTTIPPAPMASAPLPEPRVMETVP